MTIEIENAFKKFQEKERELQGVMLQKQQLELQIKEIELALDELEKLGSGEVYKSIGGLFIKCSVDEARQDLDEKLRLFKIRLNSLTTKEDSLKNQLIKLQKRLEEDVSRYEGA